ncbi:hypothetical protein FRC02_005462 [Tulasnella sp. 418]|nr:hypothetical protein FRC02_005462 [Tulasnella sp. 418]
MLSRDPQSDALFRQLKPICVPILGQSLLTPATAFTTSDRLSELLQILKELPDLSLLTPPLIEYVFFPLSTILRRNPIQEIPNHILEKIFRIMAILCEKWWWDCDLAIWEQLLKLSASIIGGLDMRSQKEGQGNTRDDETKESAVQCSLSLLRERTAEEAPTRDAHVIRLRALQEKAATLSFFPVLGQLLDGLLQCSEAQTLSLQCISLRTIQTLVNSYIPSQRLPSIIPGIISTTCKVALGKGVGRGWQSARVVENALDVLGITIINGCGDEVCLAQGAVRKPASNLEDLLDLTQSLTQEESVNEESDPYVTRRTASWLRGTSSQVHIALNTLSPIHSHPTPSALVAMARLSSLLLQEATLTLPTIHPMLLSNLLTLSTSPFPEIGDFSRDQLGLLLRSSAISGDYLNTILQITQRNLSSLPRFVLTHSEAHVERASKEIIAVCKLSPAVVSISKAISKMLGPSGGIEKWATPLLQVLEFDVQAISIAESEPSAGLIMDSLHPQSSPAYPFPRLNLLRLQSDTAQTSIEELFIALGAAAGQSALYSVEWFVDLASGGRRSREVSALWCAVKLLEGVAGVVIYDGGKMSDDSQRGGRIKQEPSERLKNVAKSATKTMASLWEPTNHVPSSEMEDVSTGTPKEGSAAVTLLDETLLPTQYIKGLSPITTLLDSHQPRDATQAMNGVGASNHRNSSTTEVHSILSLRLIAVSSSILGPEFNTLLLYAIYPILRSIVSKHHRLSEAAISTLHHVSYAAAYASPSNLLLSNFDYALDSVSRRLLRTQLDIKATKVLVILVRLVGKDVVQRAGDVVEECFDRLDEYHGYGVVVEGLVEVLGEVVRAADVQVDLYNDGGQDNWEVLAQSASEEDLIFADLLTWIDSRHNEENISDEDFGPVPHESWVRKSSGDQNIDQKEDENHSGFKEIPPTVTQALVALIFHRSINLLTDKSPFIRCQILLLMSRSLSIVPGTSLFPSIHRAWPFIVNRLKDNKVFVIVAASSLIGSLLKHAGDFTGARFWDDVWPVYKGILTSLESADRQHALAARGHGAIGTSTAFSTNHELYLSIITTLTSAFPESPNSSWSVKDELLWEIAILSRRFLSSRAHLEIQAAAKRLFWGAGRQNRDLIWLMLTCTIPAADGGERDAMTFLQDRSWDIETNTHAIIDSLHNPRPVPLVSN